MKRSPANIVVKISNVTVDIPLRRLKSSDLADDPRIVRKRSGKLFLRALDNVSLEVRRGKRIGIVGDNGNGKTTLLKLIGGMLPAASGSLEVRGSVVSLEVV
jgi:ABC-type polysaccharide/polyol phosphate transport system ATPase subunit